MNDGGAIAKQRYRYQDMCTMYISLKSYVQESRTLEHIYCEQDKLDFEIWCTDHFKGYQVKNVKNNLAAKEINQILKYYLEKSSRSRKNNQAFYFVFAQEPKNSLYYLLLKLKRSVGVQKYNVRTSMYIKTALDNLAIHNMKVDYHYYPPDEIEDMVYAISSKILKNKLNVTDDLLSKVIEYFVASFRDEIDSMSSEVVESQRVYSLNELENFVETFLAGVKIISLKDEGKKREVIKGSQTKPRKQVRPVMKKLDTSSAVEGEEVGSL